MALAIVTLTAVRNGDRITLIDRQGNKVAVVKADQLVGVHQPEVEAEEFQKREGSSKWKAWASEQAGQTNHSLAKTKWDRWSEAKLVSWKTRHKPRDVSEKECKAKCQKTWKQACRQMHINHLKRVDRAARPLKHKWISWANGVASNQHKRFKDRIV